MKAKAYDIFLHVQTIKGQLMQILGEYEEALKIHFLTLKDTEKLLSEDPDNELYHSIVQMNLNSIFTLGNLFYKMGRFLQAKSCYELTSHQSFKNFSRKIPKTSLINHM